LGTEIKKALKLEVLALLLSLLSHLDQ